LTEAIERPAARSEPAPVVTGAPRHFTYQPALDGLRAVAVSVVVLYHLGYGWMRGGFMGVDAFFVLSGFLITSLLIREHQHRHRIGLGAFWSRRARRLLPAVFLMIAVATWYGSTVTPSTSLGSLRGDAVSGVLYYANWHFISSGQSYFSLFAAPSPLTHLWSLAIEEQFYLVWPLVFAFVAARSRLRTLFFVSVGGVVASQIAMLAIYDPADPSRAYYATPARLNTMLVGCALAVLIAMRPDLVRRCSRGVLTAIALVALALCAAAWIRAQPSRAFFWGGDTVFGLAFAALLFSFQGKSTGARRVFEVRPLVWLGGISYAVYLWHWPAIVFLTEDRTGLQGRWLDVVRVAATLVVSALSMRLLERRVRRSRAQVLRWAIPATAATLAVVLVATAGATSLPNLNAKAGERCQPWGDTQVQEARREFEHRGIPAVPALRGRTIVVIGDSRACQLFAGFQAGAPLVGAHAVSGAVLGCGVVAGRFDAGGLIPDWWRNRCPLAVRRTFAKVRHQADLLVWWSAWEGEDLLVGDTDFRPGTPEHDRLLRLRMEAWLATDVPPNVKVALVLTPQPIRTALSQDRNLAAEQHPRWLNDVFEQFAAAHPDRVGLVDLNHFLCPHGSPCAPIVDGIDARPDGTHLSPTGAGLVAQWMFPQLNLLLGPPAAGG
jgi:peptidoglycan/LPS O-acetylase OafA/YrhL